MVKANLQVNQRVILLQHLLDLLSNWRLQLVVRKVQRQQTLVIFQSAQHLLHSREVLAIPTQLVALQVQELQRVVVSERLAQVRGCFGAERVALQLQFAHRFICVEDPRNVDSLLVLDLTARQVHRLQRLVLREPRYQNTDAGATQFDTRAGILAWGLVVGEFREHITNFASEPL